MKKDKTRTNEELQKELNQLRLEKAKFDFLNVLKIPTIVVRNPFILGIIIASGIGYFGGNTLNSNFPTEYHKYNLKEVGTDKSTIINVPNTEIIEDRYEIIQTSQWYRGQDGKYCRDKLSYTFSVTDFTEEDILKIMNNEKGFLDLGIIPIYEKELRDNISFDELNNHSVTLSAYLITDTGIKIPIPKEVYESEREDNFMLMSFIGLFVGAIATTISIWGTDYFGYDVWFDFHSTGHKRRRIKELKDLRNKNNKKLEDGQ